MFHRGATLLFRLIGCCDGLTREVLRLKIKVSSSVPPPCQRDRWFLDSTKWNDFCKEKKRASSTEALGIILSKSHYYYPNNSEDNSNYFFPSKFFF